MLNLLGPIAGAVFKTIDKVVDNKGDAEKLKAKVQEKILAGELAELEGAAKIIQTFIGELDIQPGTQHPSWMIFLKYFLSLDVYFAIP